MLVMTSLWMGGGWSLILTIISPKLHYSGTISIKLLEGIVRQKLECRSGRKELKPIAHQRAVLGELLAPCSRNCDEVLKEKAFSPRAQREVWALPGFWHGREFSGWRSFVMGAVQMKSVSNPGLPKRCPQKHRKQTPAKNHS